MTTHDVVVIGGSAGAFAPLRRVIAELPAGLPASLLVVLHRPSDSPSNLAGLLARESALRVQEAIAGPLPRPGTVYIAPPDRHLVLKHDAVLLSDAPRENQWRPAIDVLFRSAAVAYGPRVAGVILSGALDDGTAGLSAIKRCGGVGIAQDPADAAYAEMPASAVRNTTVDHVVPAEEIASVIQRVIEQPAGPPRAVPSELILEARIAETGVSSAELQNQWGDLTPLTCTDCGGPLWSRSDDGLRYRCLTGHALSARTLERSLGQSLEAALWASIRQFEQRANLHTTLADREDERGRGRVSASYRDRAAEARSHADELRKFLRAAVNESPALSGATASSAQ